MATAGGKTVLDVINSTTPFFQQKGVDSPRLTIELMLAQVLKRKRLQLYLEFERVLDDTQLSALRALVKRRADGEPLQYVLGRTEFYGLEFKVDKRALIPRPETELLVEHVLELARKQSSSPRILDLCTGSGCIAVVLAKHMPGATVWASDRSADALVLAKENAVALGVGDRIRLVESDLFAGLGKESFDWIVSNPPYIATVEVDSLDREIREHEPREALFGGEDGLAVIRTIIRQAPRFLCAGGHVALEIGAGQITAVQKLFVDAQYQVAKVVKDYQNHERLVIAIHG